MAWYRRWSHCDLPKQEAQNSCSNFRELQTRSHILQTNVRDIPELGVYLHMCKRRPCVYWIFKWNCVRVWTFDWKVCKRNSFLKLNFRWTEGWKSNSAFWCIEDICEQQESFTYSILWQLIHPSWSGCEVASRKTSRTWRKNETTCETTTRQSRNLLHFK